MPDPNDLTLRLPTSGATAAPIEVTIHPDGTVDIDDDNASDGWHRIGMTLAPDDAMLLAATILGHHKQDDPISESTP